MQKNLFGSDQEDCYSVPLCISATRKGLGKIITSYVREVTEKPGRSMLVFWDDRYRVIPGFNPSYSYSIVLWASGNRAGDHYHLFKREIITVLTGKCSILLKDPGSGITEEIVLNAPVEGDRNLRRLYIPEGVAHAIIVLDSPSIIHVLASAANSAQDKCSCVIEM